MSLKIGIVGLPNVGKSTLFNALTRSSQAQIANYPFCTIDPNIGIVEVPDSRLQKLAELVHPEKIVPAIIEFADIAGLVKGASVGEGLGNQFLSHIRECNAILHLVRFFSDKDIIHVHNRVDPKEDKEIIESELILADLQTLGKRLDKVRSQAKAGDKKVIAYRDLLEKLNQHLNEGKKALTLSLTTEEKASLQDLHLLTFKPVLYIANIDEAQLKDFNLEIMRKKLDLKENEILIPICAKIEADLAAFSPSEIDEYLNALGLKETGLKSLIKAAYDTLGLQTFLTAGPKEVKAWTIEKGTNAPNAAGVIHTDFIKGFIRAEVISFPDYISCGGEAGAKEKGLMRVEGKEYILQDGDVLYFRIAT